VGPGPRKRHLRQLQDGDLDGWRGLPPGIRRTARRRHLGVGRVALPADVPPAHQVTIAISVQAPPLTGPYGYAWSILQEGVAWIDPASPLHTIDVEASTKTATLCPGVIADIGGVTSALAGVQQCIDATPTGGTLELPTGIYRIDGEVQLA
jgi:hypothetical protein